MNRVRAAGALVTGLGLGAYLVGAYVTYAGRAFAVTAVMVGLTLVAIGGWR